MMIYNHRGHRGRINDEYSHKDNFRLDQRGHRGHREKINSVFSVISVV
jgi:hypothetical protein